MRVAESVQGTTDRRVTEYLLGNDHLRAAFEGGSAIDQLIAMRIATALADPQSIRMHFMQIVDLESRQKREKIVAFEALTDLTGLNPKVPSGAWVKVAAESGIISQLDRLAFRRALDGYVQQRQRLQLLQVNPDELRVTINLHAATLGQPGCADWLEQAVNEAGLETGNVVLEITEYEPLDEVGISQVWQAHHKGFAVYLDDFGEGASTVELARKLPLDGIKLSVTTTTRIERETHPLHAHAGARITEARGLRVPVIVAEGIQREDQKAILYDLGANQGQGWRFSQKCNLCRSLRQLTRNCRSN